MGEIKTLGSRSRMSARMSARMRSAALLCAAAAAWMTPGALRAQEGGAEGSIAVLTLDETSSADALVSSVRSSLERRSVEVLQEAELRARLKAQQVELSQLEALRERFVGNTTQIEEAVNAYFLKGHKAAIPLLTPPVGLGLQNPAYLTLNPALSKGVYDGAATLLRAYFDASDGPNAKALSAVLVKVFPATLPSTATVSPEVLQLILMARQDLEGQKTLLALQAVDLPRGCTIYLNGMAVVPSTFAADADTTYHLRVDCGDGQEPVIWKTRLERGVTNRIPIIARDPFSYRLKDATFESRDEIEQVFRFISRWAKLRTLVGVSKKAAGSTGDGVLMVRVERGKPAVWSDGADQVALQRVLPRILPELSGESLDFGAGQGDASAQDGGGSGRAWGWVSASLGVVALGASGYLLYVADQEAQRLRCSNPDAATTPSGCGGVERYEDLSKAEFEDRSGAVTSQRILAGGVMGAGAILTGVGIWLLVRDRSPSSEATLRIFLSPGPDHVMAGVRASF